MPNTERNTPDEFASKGPFRQPMRFPGRATGNPLDQVEPFPDLLEDRISSNSRVMEALSLLEFDGSDLKSKAEMALETVLAGGNDIGIPLNYFFAWLRNDPGLAKASVQPRAVAYSDKLWKREPLFGIVTPFHSTSVAAAIRKRPDLVGLLGEWHRVFDALDIVSSPEVAPENIENAADELIRDALKFATFLQSRLSTMTVMVGQHIYQVKKSGYPEIDILDSRNPLKVGNRTFSCRAHHVSFEKTSEGRGLSASLLIQGNRVLAMGADDTTAINQIFGRDNLGNLSMTEHIFEEATFEVRKPPSDADDFVIDFNAPIKMRPKSMKHVPLTEEFFDLISEAVSQTCVGTRAIFTAWVIIIDDYVRVAAYGGDPLWKGVGAFSMPPKLDHALLESLQFAEFEQEIETIERLAYQALENKTFTGRLEYLEFNEADLIDPVNKRMVEILVNVIKERIGVRPGHVSFRDLWYELESPKNGGRFYMNAVVDRYCAGNASPKRPFRSIK